MSDLDRMSYVVAAGNVASMVLVGPMAVIIMRRIGWPRRRMLMVSLVGWFVLWSAQVLMWVYFGFVAGFPGFRYLQPLALPISCGNLAASLWLTRPEPARR